MKPLSDCPKLTLAAIRGVLTDIDDTLTDVGRAVAGWRPMLARVKKAMTDWHAHAPKAPPAQVAEAIHFLGWLVEHNFTFLGMREYKLEGEGEAAKLVPVHDSEFGILEDPNVLFLRSGPTYVEMTAQHYAFLKEQAPIMVTSVTTKPAWAMVKCRARCR